MGSREFSEAAGNFLKNALPFAGMTRIRFQGSKLRSFLSAGIYRLPQLLSINTLLFSSDGVNLQGDILVRKGKNLNTELKPGHKKEIMLTTGKNERGSRSGVANRDSLREFW